MPFTFPRAIVRAALMLVLAGCLAGCGDDTMMHRNGSMPMHTDQVAPTTSATAVQVDEAFVRQMIPHHQMAIVMARYAQRRAEHAEVRQLADDIIASQSKEIDELRAIAKEDGYDIARATTMMGGDARTMGLSRGALGMSMMTGDLDRTDQFDRTFLAMMIPHHQGAITMANAQLAHGADPKLKAMSKSIIGAQQSEIDEMRTWQKVWFGDEATTPTTGHMMGGDAG